MSCCLLLVEQGHIVKVDAHLGVVLVVRLRHHSAHHICQVLVILSVLVARCDLLWP